MIQKYLPFILLALGLGIIVYMYRMHNTGCCDHGHNDSMHHHSH